MQQAAAPKVSFVSLGCPKALVDSERIITRLRAEGYELARKHDGADLVIVNTCGFLDSAKQESLGAIMFSRELVTLGTQPRDDALGIHQRLGASERYKADFGRGGLLHVESA